MSNYAVWNIRLRHEWISKPRKGKYLSKRKRERIGMPTADDGSSSADDADQSGAQS